MSSGTVATVVPQLQFTDRGFVAPLESDILVARLQDIDNCFGGGLNIHNSDGSPNLSNPMGQLATSDAAIIGDINSLFCLLANGVDPDYASGRMQDAIARIYFLERNPASFTVSNVSLSGAVGTQIQIGTQIVSADQNIYVSNQAVSIPSSGSITVPFSCILTGPISCPQQQFTILQSIPGLDTAISSAAGVEGQNVESRSAYEARRRASVAINAQNSVESIRGAVLAVPGVIDAYVIDNYTSQPKVIGGVTLAPHSIYVAAVGGDSVAVATALWSKKSLGCDYNGNTTIVIADTTSTINPPPNYNVTYQIPQAVGIGITVSLANNPFIPANAIISIRNAVIAAFYGVDGGTRARIGSALFASRFYAAVSNLGAWAQVLDIRLSANGTNNLMSLSLPINQVPVCAPSNIQLSII